MNQHPYNPLPDQEIKQTVSWCLVSLDALTFSKNISKAYQWSLH